MIIETKCYGETIYFDDEKHKFWSDRFPKGIESVTNFTGIFEKPGIPYWAVGLMYDYLYKKLSAGEQLFIEDLDYSSDLHFSEKNKAADLGTKIHELASKHIKGEDIDLAKIVDEDPRVAQGFDSFIEWEKIRKPKWLASEKIVYSKEHNIAGILDGLAVIDGKNVLVDIKSSNSIHDEFAFQTAGYQILEEEMFGTKIDERLVVRFAKDTEEEYLAKEFAKREKKKRQKKKYKEPEPYQIFEERTYKENDKDKQSFLYSVFLGRRFKELRKNV